MERTPTNIQDSTYHLTDEGRVVYEAPPGEHPPCHQCEQPFDFERLVEDFKKICEDYEEDLVSLDSSSKSQALQFCYQIINIIEPESRQLIEEGRDKTWECRFRYDVNNEVVTKTVFVSTYNGIGLNYSRNRSNTKISITVKEAEMLAVKTFLRICVLSYKKTPPSILMTPFAKAVFRKEHICNIAKDINSDPISVLVAINASCHDGAHYLQESEMHIAVVAAFAATMNIEPESMKHAIISMIMRQFKDAGKSWWPDKYTVYAKYAPIRLPSWLQLEIVNRIFKEVS